MLKGLKRMFGMNRYFITFYTFSIGNGRSWGSGTFYSTNSFGEFINGDWVIGEIKKNITEQNNVDETEVAVTSTNVMELSKADWNAYLKEEEPKDVEI